MRRISGATILWMLMVFFAHDAFQNLAFTQPNDEFRRKRPSSEHKTFLETLDKTTTVSLIRAISHIASGTSEREAALLQFNAFVRDWIAAQHAQHAAQPSKSTSGTTTQTIPNLSFAWMIDDPVDYNVYNGHDVWMPGVATATFLRESKDRGYALDEPIIKLNRILNEYQDFLRARDRNSLKSIMDALNYYRTHFKSQSAAARNAGYFQFRTFWEEMLRLHSQKVHERQEAMQKEKPNNYSEIYETLKKEMTQVEADPFMRGVGIRMDYPEGQFCYEARPEFFVEQFGTFVSKDVKAYLELESEAIAQPLGEDGGLIAWAEIAKRERKWEKYNSQYANSVLIPDARKSFHCLRYLLYGSENASIWNGEQQLDPGLRKVYEDYIKASPNSPSGKEIAKYYAVLKRFDFHWSPELGKALKEETGRSPYWPPEGD